MRKAEKRLKMFYLDPLEGEESRGPANALLVWVVWAGLELCCGFRALPGQSPPTSPFVHAHMGPPSSWSPPGLQDEEVLSPRAVEGLGVTGVHSAATAHSCLQGRHGHSSDLRSGTGLCFWPTNPSPGTTPGNSALP